MLRPNCKGNNKTAEKHEKLDIQNCEKMSQGTRDPEKDE